MSLLRAHSGRVLFSLTFLLFETACLGEAEAEANSVAKYHSANKMFLRIDYHGVFGNPVPIFLDGPGLVYPEFDELSMFHDYLWAGGIWLGGVINGDTVVLRSFANPGVCSYPHAGFQTVGTDSVQDLPDRQIFYTVYTDSVAGFEVRQKSFAFKNAPFRDLVIFDLRLLNFSGQTLEDAFLGVYFDGMSDTRREEICGFRQLSDGSSGDTVNVAWVADNDGNPESNMYVPESKTSVVGVKLLYPRSSDCQENYNWWVFSMSSSTPNWGPTLLSNFQNYGYLTDSGLGWPQSCQDRYYIMSNGEIDYDQNLSHLNHTGDGWLPPDSEGLDIANGYSSVFLLSCGPVVSNWYSGDTLSFAFAVIGGENFHTNPAAYDTTIPHITFYDDTNLVTNALAAQRLYDSLFDPTTDIKDPDNPLLPRSFTLHQNYPNPFNAKTTILFSLHESGPVKLEVYNLLGQKVATLLDKELTVGSHTVVWEGKNQSGEDVSSGVYFYWLTAGEESSISKMTLLK